MSDFSRYSSEFFEQPPAPVADGPVLLPVVDEVPMTAPLPPPPESGYWGARSSEEPFGGDYAVRSVHSPAEPKDRYVDKVYEALQPPAYISPEASPTDILNGAASLGRFLATRPEVFPLTAWQLFEGPTPRDQTPVEEAVDAEDTGSFADETAGDDLSSSSVESPKTRPPIAESARTGWIVARNNYVAPNSRGEVVENLAAVVLLPDGRLTYLSADRPHTTNAEPWDFSDDLAVSWLDKAQLEGANYSAMLEAARAEREGSSAVRPTQRFLNSRTVARALNTFIERLQLPEPVLDELFPDRPQ